MLSMSWSRYIISSNSIRGFPRCSWPGEAIDRDGFGMVWDVWATKKTQQRYGTWHPMSIIGVWASVSWLLEDLRSFSLLFTVAPKQGKPTMDFTMFLNGHIMGIVIDGILMGQQQLVGGLKVDGFKYVLFSILSGMIVPSDLFTYIPDTIYFIIHWYSIPIFHGHWNYLRSTCSNSVTFDLLRMPFSNLTLG